MSHHTVVCLFLFFWLVNSGSVIERWYPGKVFHAGARRNHLLIGISHAVS